MSYFRITHCKSQGEGPHNLRPFLALHRVV